MTLPIPLSPGRRSATRVGFRPPRRRPPPKRPANPRASAGPRNLELAKTAAANPGSRPQPARARRRITCSYRRLSRTPATANTGSWKSHRVGLAECNELPRDCGFRDCPKSIASARWHPSGCGQAGMGKPPRHPHRAAHRHRGCESALAVCGSGPRAQQTVCLVLSPSSAN